MKTLQELIDNYCEVDEDALYDEAYIMACELVSPNSHEFAKLEEDIFDGLVEQAMTAQRTFNENSNTQSLC